MRILWACHDVVQQGFGRDTWPVGELGPLKPGEVLAGPAARLLLSEEGDLALSSLPAELVQLAKPESYSLSGLSSCHFGELPGRSAQAELGGRGAGRARGALQQVGRVAQLPPKPPTA